MVANTVIVGLAVELLVFGVICSMANLILIDQYNSRLLLFGVLGMPCFSLIAKLRRYGVENLHFELHEAALNQFVDPPETWSHLILALLDETALRSQELVMLVRLIDEAPGPVERQDRRAEAKAWLKENRSKLTAEDKAFLNEHLGYLH